MSECFSRFYIENENIVDCKEFNDEIIKKGKSIYEVIRIIDGVPLFLEEHLRRLENSCKIENKQLLITGDKIRSAIKTLINVNGTYIGNVKLVFNYNDEGDKNLVYFIKHSYPEDKQYEEGVDTIFYFGERKNPNSKVINSSFNNEVQRIIKERDVYEAILVDNEGYITEGSRSNIFMVKDDAVFTSPLEAVLPGVTRGIIIDIIKEMGIGFKEKKVSYKDRDFLDGLFITGTSPKVLPIRTVDEYNYKSSSNEIILRIMESYNEKIKKYLKLQENR